jgi:hypothetical protein
MLILTHIKIIPATIRTDAILVAPYHLILTVKGEFPWRENLTFENISLAYIFGRARRRSIHQSSDDISEQPAMRVLWELTKAAETCRGEWKELAPRT